MWELRRGLRLVRDLPIIRPELETGHCHAVPEGPDSQGLRCKPWCCWLMNPNTLDWCGPVNSLEFQIGFQETLTVGDTERDNS